MISRVLSWRFGCRGMLILIAAVIVLQQPSVCDAGRLCLRRGCSACRWRCQSDGSGSQTISAESIFAEAAAAAARIEDDGRRADVLIEIAKCQAKAGLKDQARATFAAAQTAALRHDEATPDYNPDMDSALTQIVNAQIEAGFLSDAAATAEMIRLPGNLGRAIGAVVRALIRMGLYDEAADQVRKLAPTTDKMFLLCDIAVAQAKAGQTESARQTFAEASAIVKSKKEIFAWDYANLATSQAEAGFLDAAAAIAEKVDCPDAKIMILCAIARKEADRGNSDHARKTFSAAAALAVKTGAESLLQIAEAQIDAKMQEEATQILRLAVAEALKSKNADLLLNGIADAQQRAGMKDEAAETYRQAVDLAGQLDADQQLDVLVAAAFLQARADMKREAAKTFELAVAAAAALRNQDRTIATLKIAAAQSAAGFLTEALAVIRSIQDEKAADATGVLEIILLAELRNFDEALALTRRHPCNFHRTWCLYYIAAREIEAGDIESSRKLLVEATTAKRTAGDCMNELANCGLWSAFFERETLGPVLTESMESVIARVAIFQARAGYSAEAAATAGALDEDYLLAVVLPLIVQTQLDAGFADDALATIAEAKVTASKVKNAEARAEAFAAIGGVEAKTGRREDARGTFAEALAAAKTIRPHGGGFLSNARLTRVVDAEIDAGLLDDAKTHGSLLPDSNERDSLLERIAMREEWTRQKAEAERLLENNVVIAATDDPEVQLKSVELLANAGRFADAIATARQIKDVGLKERAFTKINLRQCLSGRKELYRETVVEWLAAIRQIDGATYPKYKEELFRLVTNDLAELGMTRELEQTFADRLVLARQMDVKGVMAESPIGFCGNDDIPAYASIAVDQVEHGRFSDGLATLRMMNDAHCRFRTLNTILCDCQKKISETDKQQVYAEALAAAREDTENIIKDFMILAELQSDEGWSKAADDTLVELLAIVRKIDNLEDRASGLSDVARAYSGVPLQVAVMAKSISDEAKNRARPIFNEAVATALKIKGRSGREQVLRQISGLQGESGLLDEAVETARHIEDAAERIQCLVGVIPSHADGDDARRIIAEALNTAETLTLESGKEHRTRWSIRRIADAAANARLFDDALAIAENISDGGDKAEMLCRIAQVQSESGKKDDARLTFTQAHAAADARHKQDVVIAQAQAGFAGDALVAARRIDNADQRAGALRGVAVEMAKLEQVAVRR